MANKVYLISEYDTTPSMDEGEVIATDLMAAIVAMRNFWRNGNAKGQGKETYSVELMGAVGAVIAEAEKVIDFE